MGLDNGIYVKSNVREITRDMLPAALVYPFDGNDTHICYWRKCWGLRNEILNTLGTRFKEENENTEIDTIEQVKDLLEVIWYFLDEDHWEDEGNSIWEYEHFFRTLRDDYMNLLLMIGFMKKNPDVYLVFYDSY